ncbi:MAG: 4Fe-4S binding protein [Oscillospiraceae bacterium]|nr:4Fe-4S binding protein [Oscillospiraceae bacterium]
MSKVTFDADRCKGCLLCQAACPKKIISQDGDTFNALGFHPATITDSAACIACAFCALMCPDCVITVERGE